MISHQYLIALHSLWLSHSNLKKVFLEGDEKLDYKEVFETVSSDFLTSLWWKNEEKITEALKKRDRYDFDTIGKTLEKCKIEIIEWDHPLYPERLKQIGHAPYFLYVRWALRPDISLIGVVWSRKNTSYGKRQLEKIIPELIEHRYGIISGWAYGIDTIAHHTTLSAAGYTISVLWTWVDTAYPAQNADLFRQIIEKWWAVISHFPLGTKPELYNFPMRNEIIAAMSLGVLIPEAAEWSGTIITAQLALEHGRDVFAIPGDIDRETSGGTNRLISTGQAKCVTKAGDILEEYENIGTNEDPGMIPIFEDESQSKIYTAIKDGYQTLDEIVEETGLALSEVMEKISLLEILGHIALDGVTGQYSTR